MKAAAARWAAWVGSVVLLATLLPLLPPVPQGKVAASDVTIITWASRRPMPTPRFALAVVTATNGKIYAIGGRNGALSPPTTAIVEEYDPATDAWRSRASMPTARYALAAVAASNGKIYAMGGYGPGNNSITTVEEYDPATDSWSGKAAMLTDRSELGAALGANGKIYAVGGVGGGGAGIISSVEEYDPDSNTWTSRASMPTARTRGWCPSGRARPPPTLTR